MLRWSSRPPLRWAGTKLCRQLITMAPAAEQVKPVHSKTKPFEKVLIANRGEIACRVIRTCKRMGIKTVAVYSDADARALHVREADEAVCIGPPPSLQSYLSIPKIIEVVKRTGARAVHPGYGFLSENKLFSKAVEEAGAVFIGPSEYSIDAMGDKITSKKIAQQAKVSTVPGYQGVVKDADDAVKIAREIGYPVMIKASAGGGGKGMRIAYDDKQAREGFRLSTEEAKSSFNDDRLFVEKYIENPHHIEIQLVADTHGNVACFPERECSIQRRNQKVLEESPSCLLKPQTREAMQAQAAMLARAVKYRSAGTVEFLVDEDQNFYFLEMNTRLQVEHPVSEYVTGEDLVEHMLWVAAGEKLPEHLIKEVGVPFDGWAFEARVYAEDPLRGFLPSTGPLITYKEPPVVETEDGTVVVRIDTGVYEGAEISMFYDPMISKLVTYGQTRAEALEVLSDALDHYVITGLGHNLCFLKALVRHPRFRKGDTPTSFIGTEWKDGFHGVELSPKEKDHTIAAAVLVRLMKADTASSIEGQLKSHTAALSDQFVVQWGKGKAPDLYDVSVETSSSGTSTVVSVTDKSGTRHVRIKDIDWQLGTPIFKADFDGAVQTLQVLNQEILGTHFFVGGAYVDTRVYTPQEAKYLQYMLPPDEIDHSRGLFCPMPGMLISVAVNEGDILEAGQEIAVVEAMKMQNILRAPRRTKVTKVCVKPGTSIKVDQVICDFEPA